MKEDKKQRAFPRAAEMWNEDELGMTLRDYFANSVLQSYVKEHLELKRENAWGYSVESIVDSAYVFADAMLKQREL